MTSIPLSEGKASTLTPTTIFVLLFHLTLMRSMGAKIVLTPTAGVVATNEFHILIGKTSMAIITIYIAIFHTSKLFTAYACAVKNFNGYLQIHTNR